jgi:hypothetical protein
MNRYWQAEIVSTIEEEAKRQEGLDLEEQDEDAMAERRRRIKEKLRQRDQEKEEEEEESEYDTDSDEEYTGVAMVFVPKSERDTIAECERLEEARKSRMEERRTDNIFTRDFSAPTGEDKMDKTVLPKVIQVKHFGRSGRTKWSHLVNEDTTDWNNP